jgi:hypothetical protein
MANEIRIRSNFQSGTITDNPLTNVATTINSAAFASLPAVTSTSHLPIVMDPTGSAGAPEIIYITAHTALATSATVVRGQEGSSARQHATGMTWRHAALVSDYDSVLGYAQVTANQGTFTTEVDLTSLTVTVTVPYAAHRIKVSAFAAFQSSVASDTVAFRIKEGATVLQECGVVLPSTANNNVGVTATVVLVPTAAAHTYKLSALKELGTGNITMGASATAPAFILVEDLGPAA